jgi:hypothetical protein
MSEPYELFQEGIAAFICPLTNSFYEDPVVAEDGQTYSRTALLDYFSCKEKNDPITSPLTRNPMTESIVDDIDVANAIREYKEKRGSAQVSSARTSTAAVQDECVQASGRERVHYVSFGTRGYVCATRRLARTSR